MVDANEERPEEKEKKDCRPLSFSNVQIPSLPPPDYHSRDGGIDQLYSKVFLNLAEWANFGALSRSSSKGASFSTNVPFPSSCLPPLEKKIKCEVYFPKSELISLDADIALF